MKVSKIVSLILVVVLAAVALTACGGGNDASVLSVATNAEFPPFEYMEGEEMVGFDIDMMNAIAEKMGVEIEYANIEFDATLTGAATGKYDIALSGITATDERKQNMAFTDSYYKASQSVIVMADSEYKAVADLAGKTISCQEGTTGELYLRDNGYEVQAYKTGSEAITALVSGKCDAVCIDDAVAQALSAEQAGKTVVLDEAMTKEEYAMATKLGNDELLEKVNAALAELKADGTLDALYAKYELVVD